jgi:Glycosyltransferase family 87
MTPTQDFMLHASAAVEDRRRVHIRMLCLIVIFGLCAGAVATLQWPQLLANIRADNARELYALDFTAFYAAAQMIGRAELVELYDIQALTREIQALSGLQIGNSWAYPPHVNFAIGPLVLLPELAAFWVFVLAPVVVLALTLAAIVPWPLGIAVATLFPATLLNVYTSNTGSIAAALVAVGLASLSGMPILAGAAFALAAHKPHLVLILPLLLAATKEWRALAAMLATGVALFAASLVAHGVEPWLAFAAKIPAHLDHVSMRRAGLRFPEDRLPTAYIAVLMQTDLRAIAAAVQSAVSVLAIAGVVRVWLWTTDMTLRSLALAAALLLATPYAFDYDMAVLALPFALLLHRSIQTGWPAANGALLILLWIGPMLAWGTVRLLGFQMVPLLLLALLLYVVVQAEQLRRAAISGAHTG